MNTTKLAATMQPYFWMAGAEKVFPKNHWTVSHNGRNFVVSKSSFGWHAQIDGKYPAGFEVVYASKAAVLQAIIDKA